MSDLRIGSRIRIATVPIVFVVLTILIASGIRNQTVVAAEPMPPESEGQAQARSAVSAAPRSLPIEYLSTPPALSEAQRRQNEMDIKRTHQPGPPLAIVAGPVGPEGPETFVSLAPHGTAGIKLQKDTVLTMVPTYYRSVVDEPSVANNGNVIFYTGNWYAARSTTNGSSFSYINTYKDMSSFCCDQDTLYEPTRHIFLWYRQGSEDSSGVNFFRLGVANSAATSWTFYDFYPSDLDSSWTNQWFDYPQMALGSNFLYVTTNMFDSSDSWTRTVLLRLPLDQLAQHTTLNYKYISDEQHFTYTPVQGATSTIYWASHVNNSQIILYSWAEDSESYSYYTRKIPAWTYETKDGGLCRGPDGSNACARSDSRILTGWVANGLVGFLWNAKQGKGFAYPYVNGATFRTSAMSYVARPEIWNPKFAFQYAATAPNAQGTVGISVAWGGGQYYPQHAVGTGISPASTPTNWQLVTTSVGNDGPRENKWGDYLRVRPYQAGSRTWWIATGFFLYGGGENGNTQPQLVIFSAN